MIEVTILNHLKSKLTESVHLEKPKTETNFVVFEKTSSGKSNHLLSSTFAFQSYGKTLYQAAELNNRVKTAVESLIELDDVAGVKLNSDYNFTDTTKKEYRYQAVFDINHY